ncbi:MAG: hypothetical protein LUO89_02790 [Methanothrix sp.]|nr:hypothetical protein [Methanothrix sp.]
MKEKDIMDISLLKKHIDKYKKNLEKNPEKHTADLSERIERIEYYQAYNEERITNMSEEDFYQYMARLWAMLIWGNKKYAIDKIVNDNGFEKIKLELSALVWGKSPIESRWDRFKKNVKGFGPAMMSELLCYAHPSDCLLWNRRAYVGFNYLGVPNLPRYDYQLTGKRYSELCELAKAMATELTKHGIKDVTLLTVDYFIWDELQVEDNLSKIFEKPQTSHKMPADEPTDKEVSDFIHDEIRDKLADIGRWLGFDSEIEKKVADGSRVDTIWEFTIGNMGRVIYAFEVQTKGSTDSLIINLLKAINNPAVQGIVAVSDLAQLEKIKKHADPIIELNRKLKYWDYKEVLRIHESLKMVNESINSLGLVPQGF